MNKNRIDAITGLRGLAALLVLYAHLAERAWHNPDQHFPGEVGVAIFFSLSGFLISYLYREKNFSRHCVADYVTARIARIAPAYLSVVLASYFIYMVIDPHFIYAISTANLARHLVFSGNVSALWSIAPEVQFYVLFLLVWAVNYRWTKQADYVSMLLLALLFIIMLTFRDGFPGTFVGAKLHYFVFGAIAGAIRAKIDGATQDNISVSVLHLLLLGMMAAVACNLIAFPFTDKSDFYQSIPTALLSSLFVLSFSLPSPVARILLGNRFMTLCGECSFSIYLLNLPIIYVFQKMGLGLPSAILSMSIILVVLALSWVNYQLIERPGARSIRALSARIASAFSRQAGSAQPAGPNLPA